MTITTDQFLTGLKRLITVPQNQSLMTAQALLDIAQRNIQDTIVPEIDAVNQEFFLWKSTQALVADQAEYRIPARAAARKLRDLKLIDSSLGRREIVLVPVEREHLYRQTGIPFGFYFYGDRIALLPTPSSTDYTLQFWFFLAPGYPVLTTEASPVLSATTTSVTVSYVPSGIVTGSVVDFIQGTSGNGYLAISKRVTAKTATTISFASGDIPTDLAAGDWISPEGYSPVIQLPDPATYYLQTICGMEVLFSLGDFEAYDRLEKISKGKLENLRKVLEPRIEGEPTVILNQYGLVGGARRGYTRGWLFYA